jgi:hypothetical protein
MTFTCWIPAGWTRIDLTGDVDAALHAAIGPAVRAAPVSRQPEARRLLIETVGATMHTLAERGALCVLLPLDPTDPDPVRPVVAIVPLDVPDGTDPVALAAGLAREDPTASLVDLPGLIAVRTHSSHDATDRFLAAMATAASQVDGPVPDTRRSPGDPTLQAVRVGYVLGDPDHHDRWLTIELALEHPSTEGGTVLRDRAVALFDAVVSTFRWLP